MDLMNLAGMTQLWLWSTNKLYIIFLFSGHYVDIMLLIWSKNWSYIYWLLLFLIRIKFGLSQISMAKISKAMLAIDSINNPCKLWLFGLNIGSSKISRSGRNYLFHGFF